MSDVVEKYKGLTLKISRFWAWCKTYETIRKSLSWGIIFLFLVLIAIMLSSSVEKCFEHLTGIDGKPELLKFIGWGISGLIAILVAIGLLQRVTVLDEQNKINKEGQKKEHVHERFKAAIDHLGNERGSVRIAAFYEFYRLAKVGSYMQEPIFDILCAHLRQTTKDENYQKKERELDTDKAKEIKPTEEMQSLLDILFKPVKNNLIFDGLVANLEGANLQGANLYKANLNKANLKHVNLQNATFGSANLQEADMWKANLREAILLKTNLQEAKMEWVDLRGVNPGLKILQEMAPQMDGQDANMQGAILQGAKIDKNTKLPDDWKNVVKKDKYGKTGVWLVDDKGKIIEML